MITAHQLILRWPDKDGATTVTGPFDRVAGGWRNPRTADWYSDAQLLKATGTSVDTPDDSASEEFRCECGEVCANKAGLSSHIRNKHGKEKTR